MKKLDIIITDTCLKTMDIYIYYNTYVYYCIYVPEICTQNARRTTPKYYMTKRWMKLRFLHLILLEMRLGWTTMTYHASSISILSIGKSNT